MNYQAARRNMVDSQLRTNKVTDPRILDAFETLPRERFLPEARRNIAYIDEDIEIASGRFLMEPMVLARLIQAAEVKASDMVLDVGCATGYSTAALARLAATVVGLESDLDLAKAANTSLSELSIDNALVVEGQLVEGHQRQGPYDVILISGSVEVVPESLTGQLTEGGRLVTVERRADGLGRALLLLRGTQGISRIRLFDAATPILPGFQRPPAFVF